MERIFQMLLTAGYPSDGVDWLRQHRSATIVGLALAAWIFFIAIGWLIWRVIA